MADNREKLFSDFPPVATEDWMKKIMIDLKGADYEKKLVWKTNEGFKVKPFYRKEDIEDLKTIEGLPGQFPFIRGNKKKDNTWFVRQNIRVDNPVESNRKALDILNKGVDSLGFILPKNIDLNFLRALLKDICCDCVELNFSTCQNHTVQLGELLVAYFKETGCKPEAIRGSINYDPIEKMMSKGKKFDDFILKAKSLVEMFEPFPNFRCIGVDSVVLNNSGAYIYQELGYALAWGNEYLNALIDAGLPSEVVAKKIKFNFGISSNYFMEIAKFRAGRMLWANIVKEYKPQCTCENCDHKADGFCHCACKMAVHAETSKFNQTLFDAYVNLLRSQTEAMSAALASVDSITVNPFDGAYNNPDEFSERIARNQQLLLKEEAHMNRIVDPAAGSYYIENLTVAIAQQAWELFLKVEEEGGMLKCIEEGKIQDAVNASNEARRVAVSKRRETLLGTNQFPNFNETAGDKMPKQPGCGIGTSSVYKTLNQQRAASEFEELRMQTEKSGKRPKAFMLTIGNLAMRQARAQFSCNFLACAGYEVIDNLGFATVEEGVNAAMNADADIVVMCSSDDEYAEYAIPAFQALNGRAMYIVAGAPACMDDLKAAGIENFIHVRCNVLETLKEYNAKLGIS